MSQSFVFYVNKMKCAHCRGSIEQSLRNATSITLQNIAVDITMEDPKRTIVIIEDDPRDHKIIWEEIKQIIEDIGYPCKPYDYPNEEPIEATTPSQSVQTPPPGVFKTLTDSLLKIVRSHWFLGALGCTVGLAMLITSLALGGLPLTVMIPFACISTILTLILGANSYYDAWQKLVKARALTMDTLFSISTLSVLAVSITSFFVPWLPMMFEASLLIYGFRHIGIALEDNLKQKISSAKFQDRVPKSINLYHENKEISLKLQYIKPHDIILVKPGEIIPLDGICLEESSVYTTIINGASLPVPFRKGETVLAGMTLGENSPPLKISVTKTAQHSYLARLDEGIAQSILEKAPLEIKTNHLLNWFIPSIIVLSLISGLIIGIFFPPALAIQCSLSVLVSACPCTLGLIIPLAVKTGMHKAAEHGVQFINAKVLQEAEQIDTVVFDLNGTLTTGVPLVKQFIRLDNNDISPNQLLGICSAIEEQSTHPIGKAIRHFASQKNAPSLQVSPIDSSQQSGITGVLNNTKYSIGNMRLMENQGVEIPVSVQLNQLEAGDSVVYIAQEKKLVGYMVMTDPLRKDAIATINLLTQMGKTIHLCTGADQETASRYAKALNISHVHANCVATSSEDNNDSKPNYIKSLQNNGSKVAMIGDAGNDAQAIAVSDFGIAVISKNSDELTQRHAGAVIHNDSLLAIPNAFAISTQTVTNIKQNLIMSLSYNLATVLVAGGLLVGIGFTLNPAVGVALMAIQACVILFNVYRFKNQSLDHLQDQPIEQELTTSSQQMSQSLSPNTPPKPEHQSKESCFNEPPSVGTEFWNAPPDTMSDSTSNLQVINR